MISKRKFLDQVSTIAESVYDFHDRFQITGINETMTNEDIREILMLRILLQTEEVGEMCQALSRDKIYESLGEAADVLYVALGTMLVCEEPGLNSMQNVTDKNNQKNNLSHLSSTLGKITSKKG
jgi:NTP pyrophosphatase (non-canonical NTP hydrolase)